MLPRVVVKSPLCRGCKNGLDTLLRKGLALSVAMRRLDWQQVSRGKSSAKHRVYVWAGRPGKQAEPGGLSRTGSKLL